MIELSGEWSLPTIKKLLANCGPVWLFEICEGRPITYQVERDDRCWRFDLLSLARAKYDGEVGKLPHSNIAAWSEKTEPGAPDSAEWQQL